MLTEAEQRSVMMHARGMATAKKRITQQLRMGLVTTGHAQKLVKHAEDKLRNLLKEVG